MSEIKKSTKLFDEKSGRYFDQLEDILDLYMGQDPADVPEKVYHTRFMKMKPEWRKALAQNQFNYIKANIPELSEPGKDFIGSLVPEAILDAEMLQEYWITRNNFIIEPDKDDTPPILFRDKFIQESRTNSKTAKKGMAV